MRRQLVPTCLLLGAALLAPALLALLPSARTVRAAEGGLRSAARAPVSDARACKPQGPVATTLTQLAAHGDVVELAFAVTPHADAGALRWSLQLPPGAQLLEGAASGALPAGAAGTGALVARVKLAPGAAEVALAVEGSLARSAGPQSAREPLLARRALRWDPPQTPVADARTPVRHRSGR